MCVWKNGGKVSHLQTASEMRRCNERTDNLGTHGFAHLCINKGHTVPLKVSEEGLEWIPRKKSKDREKDVDSALKDHILEEIDRQALQRPHHNIVRNSERQ